MLNRTVTGQPLNWYKTLSAYYYRDEWELFDLNDDPHELYNVAHKKTHKVTPFLFHNQAYSETFT